MTPHSQRSDSLRSSEAAFCPSSAELDECDEEDVAEDITGSCSAIPLPSSRTSCSYPTSVAPLPVSLSDAVIPGVFTS